MDLEKTEQKSIYSKFAGYVALPNVCLLSCKVLEIFKIFLKFCLYWFSSIYVFDIQYLISFFFFFNQATLHYFSSYTNVHKVWVLTLDSLLLSNSFSMTIHPLGFSCDSVLEYFLS